MENLLRVKGIDPDEFLNQKTNNHGDEEDGDENELSDCSECSCEECCGEDCHDENQSGEKSDETTSDQGKNEAGSSSTSKIESQQTNSSGNKVLVDEHNKRAGKDRLNVNLYSKMKMIDLWGCTLVVSQTFLKFFLYSFKL